MVPLEKRGKKVSTEIADRRREEVRRALGRAEHTYDIATRLAAEWDLTRRQIDTYISQVREQAAAEIAARGETERQANTRRLEDMLLEAAALARSRKDAKGVVAAARELGKLQSCYAPERIEMTGAGGAPLLAAPTIDLTRFSDAQVTAFLQLAASIPVLGSGEPAAVARGGGAEDLRGVLPGDDPGRGGG